MKRLLKAVLLFFVFVFLYSCSSTEPEKLGAGFTAGTVIHGGVEGPAFGIRTDDGKNLDPINLSHEYEVYGKRIALKYNVQDNLASTHMWGTIVLITSIRDL